MNAIVSDRWLALEAGLLAAVGRRTYTLLNVFLFFYLNSEDAGFISLVFDSSRR